jgi:hypothetical protein
VCRRAGATELWQALSCALGAQCVEREVKRVGVFRCGPDVKRRAVRAVLQRRSVSDADAKRGLPRAGLVERVAQRLNLEVPDAAAARNVHPQVIPASGAGKQACCAAQTVRIPTC